MYDQSLLLRGMLLVLAYTCLKQLHNIEQNALESFFFFFGLALAASSEWTEKAVRKMDRAVHKSHWSPAASVDRQ